MEFSQADHTEQRFFGISASHHNSQRQQVNPLSTPAGLRQSTGSDFMNCESTLAMMKSSLLHTGFQYYYETYRLLIEEHQRNYHPFSPSAINSDTAKLPLMLETRSSADKGRKCKGEWDGEITTTQMWRNVDKLNPMSVGKRISHQCLTVSNALPTFPHHEQIAKKPFGKGELHDTYPTIPSSLNVTNKPTHQASSVAHFQDCQNSYDLENYDKYSRTIRNTSLVLKKLAKITNRIGPYLCRLCGVEYTDAIQLAGHRCPFILHAEYRCPDCEKVFNCPANLASHRRWHRPKSLSLGQGPNLDLDGYSRLQSSASSGHPGTPDMVGNPRRFCTNYYGSCPDKGVCSCPFSSPIQKKASTGTHCPTRQSICSGASLASPSPVEKDNHSLPWFHNQKKNLSFTVDAILGVESRTPPSLSPTGCLHSHGKLKLPGHSRQTQYKRKVSVSERKPRLLKVIGSQKIDFKSGSNNEPGQFCAHCSTMLPSKATFQEHMFEHLMEHAKLERPSRQQHIWK